MPTFNVETVTPELAAEWLASNHVNNRKLRKNKVAAWTRAMLNGTWTLTNDAICFGEDGTLYNGQHRLTAVVAAGIPIQMLVGRGLDAGTFRHMDRGPGRTMSDHLTVASRRSAPLLAATLRLLVVALDSSMTFSGVGDDEMWRFLDEHPDVEHSVTVANTEKSHVDCGPTALAAAHWLIAQRNGSDLADYFIRQVARREGEPTGSAVHAIANRLRISKRTGRRTFNEEVLALLIRGWNTYARGRTIKVIDFPPRHHALPVVAAWSRSQPHQDAA